MSLKIFDDIVSIVTEICQLHHKETVGHIEKHMRLRDDIGFDSVELVILQIEIEDRFHVRFDPLEDDFRKMFYSIGTLCKCLELKIGENYD